MSNIAVVTDSNSGITQKQAEELGIYVLPMPFIANNTVYYEDINLSTEEFYEMLAAGVDIKTSQPALEELSALWDKILQGHDSIVHIPMSSGLSSSCQTAMVLAEEYDGKVAVVDNQRISVTQRQSVLDALQLVKEGKSHEQIRDILVECKLQSSIYIMLDTLYYLRKGGRITPAAAALGTALRLKPVLQIQGEKLDAFAVARTKKQGISKMIEAMGADIEKRFGGAERVHLSIAHTRNEEMAEKFRDDLLAIYPNREIVINPLSLSISCHIGPGALAIACSQSV